ncbi:hypothetical protein ABTZ99_40400 [Actinosynnema sp. NPDC002837]
MNLRPQDLIDDRASGVGREVSDDGGVSTGLGVPTFAEMVPEVAGAAPATTRESCDAYWKKIVAVWGGRRLDAITVSDVRSLFEYVKAAVVVRRSANGGRSAVQHTYNALLCVYRYAVSEEVITDRQNVMSRVAKPSRSHSRRHGLDAVLVGRIVEVASSTGNDPALDALLLRLHLETACRRGGAPALRVRDLDSEQCLILLREKGGGSRWQPVSPTLMAHLQYHARARGACEPATAVQALTGERHPPAVPEESSAARAEAPIVRTAPAGLEQTGVAFATGGEHRSAFGPLAGAAVAASSVQIDTDRSAAPVDGDMESGRIGWDPKRLGRALWKLVERPQILR